MKLPTLFNSEGESLKFIQLRYSFAKGATQNQIRELLNDAPDMDAASSKFWNWVAPPDEEPESRPKQAGTLTNQVHMDSRAVVLGTIELMEKNWRRMSTPPSGQINYRCVLKTFSVI